MTAPHDFENKLAQIAYEQYRHSQDRVFSIAAGTLALSITFRSSLLPDPPANTSLLAAAWIALCATIAFHLLSLAAESGIASTASHLLHRVESYSNGIPTDERDSIKLDLTNAKRAMSWVIPGLRIGVWLSFLVGTICFLRFALLNIGG